MKCRECGRGRHDTLDHVIQEVLKYREDITFEGMRVTNNSSILIGANIAIYIPVGSSFYNAYTDFKVMAVLYRDDKEIQIVGHAEKQETVN